MNKIMLLMDSKSDTNPTEKDAQNKFAHTLSLCVSFIIIVVGFLLTITKIKTIYMYNFAFVLFSQPIIKDIVFQGPYNIIKETNPERWLKSSTCTKRLFKPKLRFEYFTNLPWSDSVRFLLKKNKKLLIYPTGTGRKKFTSRTVHWTESNGSV